VSKYVPSYFTAELKSMQDNLSKAAVKITFEAYLGLMVFSTLLAAVLGFGFSLLIFSIRLPLVPSFVFSLIAAMIAGIVVFGFCYVYPVLTISSKVRKIDSNLPLTANFMAVLASSGMPPERIFRSLANVGDEFGVGEEMRCFKAGVFEVCFKKVWFNVRWYCDDFAYGWRLVFFSSG
jgi:archaellum biogenesis protein FlaJ (TadC family)